MSKELTNRMKLLIQRKAATEKAIELKKKERSELNLELRTLNKQLKDTGRAIGDLAMSKEWNDHVKASKTE